MDFLVVYNTLLNRGKNRIYFPGSHRHRIVPGYQGGKYTIDNITYLTRQEHRIIHLIRYKLWGNPADRDAYIYLGGKNAPKMYGKNNNFYGRKHTHETIELMRRAKAGRKLGKYGSERILKQANSRARDWMITNPKGKVFEIHNLNKFCRENDLQQANMVQVAKGTRNHHKGWKCQTLTYF